MRTFTTVVGLGLALALCSGAALAQSDTTSLTGSVDICDDRPLTNFRVRAQAPNLSDDGVLVPVDDGTFAFRSLLPPFRSLLPPGHYELAVVDRFSRNRISELHKVRLVAGELQEVHFTICPPEPRFKVGPDRRCYVVWPSTGDGAGRPPVPHRCPPRQSVR